MKITLFAAISANGMIARENDEEDFLSDENWQSFCELASKKKCIIWGRKTYEAVKKWENRYLEKIKDVTKVIISKNDIEEKEVLSAKTPQEAIEILEESGFDESLLAGGSVTNSSFAKLNLIDDLIVNIESVVVSKGIPMFSEEDFDLDLQLLDMKKISNDIIQLHYKIKK